MASTTLVKEFCDRHGLSMDYNQSSQKLNISLCSRVILSQTGNGPNKKICCNDAARKCFGNLQSIVIDMEKIPIHEHIGVIPVLTTDKNLSNEDYLQENIIHRLTPIGWELVRQEYEVIPGKMHLGKGDLVFKKDNTLLVIEVKGICWNTDGKTQRVKRHNALRKCEYQATKYASIWRFVKKSHDKVISCVATTPKNNNEYGLKIIDIIQTPQQAKTLLQKIYDQKEFNNDALLVNLFYAGILN